MPDVTTHNNTIRPDRMEFLTERERIPERVDRLERALSGGLAGSGGGTPATGTVHFDSVTASGYILTDDPPTGDHSTRNGTVTPTMHWTTATLPSHWTVTLDGSNAGQDGGSGRSTFSFNIDPVALTPGSHTFVVQTTDSEVITSTATYVVTTTRTGTSGGGLGGTLVGFHAHRNGTNLSLPATTFTKVIMTTEDFDIGGYYDTSNGRFTPVAGYYRIGGSVGVSGNNRITIVLYKNGSEYKRLYDSGLTVTGGYGMAAGSAVIYANGSDYFELYVWSTNATTIDGTAAFTFFNAESATGAQGGTGPPGADGADGDPGGLTYYEQASDPGAVMSGAIWVDTDETPPAYVGPSRVTSLPSSPVEGQEIYYVADSTNGIIWHLRYNSLSGSTYKWEFVGGAPLYVNSTVDEVMLGNSNSSNTGYVQQTTDVALTHPLAGDYMIEYGAKVAQDTGTGQFWIGILTGTTQPNDEDSMYWSSGGGNTPATQYMSRTSKRTGVTAGTVSRIAGHRWGIATPHIGGRFMSMVPVRVG